MIEQIFSSSINSIIIADKDGIITKVNEASIRMLGYAEEELINLSIEALYTYRSDFEKVLTEINHVGHFTGNIINKTKSGKNITTYLSANRIFDHEGHIIGTMGISRDITEELSTKNKYDQVLNMVPEIIYHANLEGYFTFVNQATMEILGYEQHELVNTRFSELIHKPHLILVNEHYKSHLNKKTTNSYLEFKVNKKDGTPIWVGQKLSTKFNMHDPSKIDGFIGVVRDINKQKESTRLLSESEMRYRELFDASSDLIQSITPNGDFLYVNKVWKKAMGYTDEELKSINILTLIHPDSLPHCKSILNDILNLGKNKKQKVVYDLITKDGNIITVEGAFNIKLIDNKVVSIQSFLRDITEQNRLENQLTKKEQILRQITESLSDVFYLYNISEQKYEYISTNCIDVLGADQEFFYSNKSHTESFIHPEDREKLNSAQEIVESGNVYDIDYRIIVNDEIKWINEKSFPIKDKLGNTISNSGICSDITKIKRANEIIYNQNIEIGSSILYAKQLQESALPKDREIQAIFPDSFVMYKPKDVVSGDFYVVDEIKSNDQNTMPTFIVGDCTGHGVPGAVLSLMCIVLIKETYTRHEINSPAEALEFVRSRLVKFFKASKDNIVRDGMDIAFCVLNKTKKELYFSGGYNSCVIIRGRQILEYKGDKQHIGYTDNPKPFNNHIIKVKSGDLVYLYTDGIKDQFGGERKKKFTKKRLHELLVDSNQLSMEDAHDFIETAFENWKDNNEQIDDVTILGVRID